MGCLGLKKMKFILFSGMRDSLYFTRLYVLKVSSMSSTYGTNHKQSYHIFKELVSSIEQRVKNIIVSKDTVSKTIKHGVR